MNTGYYICPSCHRRTVEMQLSEERYTPTETELRRRPDMAHIAHELLDCPCGLRLTWFTVREMASGVN